MTEGIVIANFGSKVFGINLHTFPIILKASKVFEDKNALSEGKDCVKIYGREFKVINVHKLLNIKPNAITDQSRIIARFYQKEGIGFLVDEVTEFLSVDLGSELSSKDICDDDDEPLVLKTYKYNDERIKVIDMENTVE